MSITIQAKESIQAPIQTIASIVVHSLLDELVDISRKINEGKSDSKDPWEESLLSTACEYTIEAIGERLQNCIGKEYLSISALNDDLYHALEPLKLVEATEPKTSRMVTWGIGRALRDYEALTTFLDQIEIDFPVKQVVLEPEVKRARRKSSKEATHA